ncbi:hypothetical protein NE236_00095 [Actinoallomurus purpureus]|uniref:hypothetical protein n=1 Tax=Actinoallomurus purpureus TaxID=478114 RepID=UPI0020926CE2|nr:hypothetical protein [Actinoallomurus purpureus]MCO6003377.1 hypothetical protein [Actinoallomurus purpureus]
MKRAPAGAVRGRADGGGAAGRAVMVRSEAERAVVCGQRVGVGMRGGAVASATSRV